MDEREDFSKGVLGEIHDTLRPLFLYIIRHPECDDNVLAVAVYDTKRKEVQLRMRVKREDGIGNQLAIGEWTSLPTRRAVREYQRQQRNDFQGRLREFDLDGQFIQISPTASFEEIMSTLQTSNLFNIKGAE
jgi:hypothetical protein